MKFDAAGFIVPFFFIYSPALLFEGPWTGIALAVVMGIVTVTALAAGGHPGASGSALVSRAALIALALIAGTIAYRVFRLYA